MLRPTGLHAADRLFPRPHTAEGVRSLHVARAHGRGIATEAVRAIVAWADRALAAECTACIISPANAASLRVAAKAGYREVRRTTYKAAPTIVSERARLSPSA